MRTFVRLRQLLATNAGLAKKLTELELKYDHHFKVVFDAIRELMAERPARRRPPIGYHTEIRKARGRKSPAAIERLGPHMNERKNQKRKPTAKRAA